MTYKIEVCSIAKEQIRALPPAFPQHLAEAMALLELTPWQSLPINEDNPNGAVRQLVFGPNGSAMLVFLILEQQSRVDLLEVIWHI